MHFLSTSRRPEFISREKFRQWLSTTEINRHMIVGGVQPGSYVARAERLGNPIQHRIAQGQKRWRLIDIVARANAHGDPVEPVRETALIQGVRELERRKASLQAEVSALTDYVERERHSLVLDKVSHRLTGKSLLTSCEIAAGSTEIPRYSGVYFLLKGTCVVYVGQSIHVFSRVTDHLGSKDFDSFAWIACPPASLDMLESLYIHTLRPVYNTCERGSQLVFAPISLDRVLTL